MEKAPTIRAFRKQFPTEEACLDHLMRVRWGERHDCAKCGKSARFYRVKERRSYACEYCGHQVYPTAGTPFDRTRTPLTDWFFVMHQFCTSRHGVAAKEVERQLGVTYKTAWRMCHQIREYMGEVDGNDQIGGLGRTVQMDETFIGGYQSYDDKREAGASNKMVVFGMLEVGGDIVTKLVPDRRSGTLLPIIRRTVIRGAKAHTDEWLGYGGLASMGYIHGRVNHSIDEYVSKTTGATVNTIEAFWSQLKRGINGTHIHVSAKHLPKYLREFEFRYNMRRTPHLMLDRLLHAFVR